MSDTNVIDRTDNTHLEPDQVTGELKPVNEEVRPDPQPEAPTIESTSSIPAHEPDAIAGVIQHKEDPDGPIKEKLPSEQDLQEGKITPQAVEKPQYDFGVTHDDVVAGKVSPSAVRETNRPLEADEDMNDMITMLRNKTQLARLNRVEVAEVIQALKNEGYSLTKAPQTTAEAVKAA